MKEEHILIQRDDKDYHLDLYIDSYGCYSLGMIYDLDIRKKQLSQNNQEYMLITEEGLRITSHRMYTIAKVLEILEETTCGCCNSPWLNSDTFDNLVEQFRKHEGVI